MKPLVIFGTTELGEVAHFYFRHDTEHEVVAFAIDKAYLETDTFEGLPLVAFEEVEKKYPPTPPKSLSTSRELRPS